MQLLLSQCPLRHPCSKVRNLLLQVQSKSSYVSSFTFLFKCANICTGLPCSWYNARRFRWLRTSVVLPPIPSMLSLVSYYFTFPSLSNWWFIIQPLPAQTQIPCTAWPRSKQVALLDYPLDTTEHPLLPFLSTPSLILPIASLLVASWASTPPKVLKTYSSKSKTTQDASAAPWSSAGEILYSSWPLPAPAASTSVPQELWCSSRIPQLPRVQSRWCCSPFAKGTGFARTTFRKSSWQPNKALQGTPGSHQRGFSNMALMKDKQISHNSWRLGSVSLPKNRTLQ